MTNKTIGIAAGFLTLMLGLPNDSIRSQQSTDVKLNDSSDWWSSTNYSGDINTDIVQNREIPASNFRILKIDVLRFSFEEVKKRLGNATTVRRGDAVSFKEQSCYISSDPKHKAYLTFEQGAISSSLYLFSEDIPWNGRNLCFQSQYISRQIRTESGLHLGQTMVQVIDILGKPSKHSNNELVYVMASQVKTPPEEFDRIREHNPELNDKEIHDAYDVYDRAVFIRARFNKSGMIYLAIAAAE
jgi:hypothetical protein